MSFNEHFALEYSSENYGALQSQRYFGLHDSPSNRKVVHSPASKSPKILRHVDSDLTGFNHKVQSETPSDRSDDCASLSISENGDDDFSDSPLVDNRLSLHKSHESPRDDISKSESKKSISCTPESIIQSTVLEAGAYIDDVENTDNLSVETRLIIQPQRVHKGTEGMLSKSVGLSTAASNSSRTATVSPGQGVADRFFDDDYSIMNKEEEEDEEELAGLLSHRSLNSTSYLDGWNQSSHKSKQEDNLLQYVAKERAHGMEKIKQQAAQVFHVFKELNNLIHEQQDDLDLLDTSMLNIKASTKGAVDELKRAHLTKQKARRRKVFFIVITFIIGLIVIALYSMQASTPAMYVVPSNFPAAPSPSQEVRATNVSSFLEKKNIKPAPSIPRISKS